MSISARTVFGVSLLVVAIYFIVTIGSDMASILAKDKLAFYISPHHVDRVVKYLRSVEEGKDSVSEKDIAMIVYFHRLLPEVNIALADATFESDDKAGEYYIQAVIGNPMNDEYFRKLVSFAVERGNGEVIARVMPSIVQSLFSPRELESLPVSDFTSPYLLEVYLRETAVISDTNDNRREKFAKHFYVLGLRVVDVDPELTRALWIIARDLAPGWSYFHVEIASLGVMLEDDFETTKRILVECMLQKDAKEHCQDVMQSEIPPVGFFEQNIRVIPRTL